MVHALDKAHRVIRPGGALLDIHPLPDEPLLEVRVDEVRHAAGVIHETDDGIEYRQAEAALADAIREGLFRVEIDEQLEFRRYADSLADLQQYFAEAWKDAFIDPPVARRIETLLATPRAGTELIVREQIRMTRYRRVDR